MNKIRNFLMLMAVVIAVTGAFAFKAKVMPPGNKWSVSGSSTVVSIDPVTHIGTIIICPGTTVENIDGKELGDDYLCDPNAPVCTFEETSATTTFVDPETGCVTYFNVLIEEGLYRTLP